VKQALQRRRYGALDVGVRNTTIPQLLKMPVMKRAEEWDWPPTRRRKYYRTFDIYQPGGWNSPGVKKAINIYWRVTITIIKALIAIPLSIMVIGGLWLLWTIITF
jgi:hypothetical protein